jgi:uncharacterized YccA/Bax inhibitor family protein
MVCLLCVMCLPAGPIAIVIGLVSAGLAASNLLIDFSFIERLSYSRSAPQWMEWYSAQSLCITLVWMYTEMIRLLMAFAGMGGRDD